MKLALLIALAVFALLVPTAARAATGGPGDGGIYTTKLANGLQVVVVEDTAAPVVQTGMWYRFGSLDELPGKTGLAHALEHMMFRGTTHISAGGLDDIVARLGAQMNGETNYDYTDFYFEMPADKLDVALYIEADRMQHLLLAQSGWDVERLAVLNEIDGDESSPFYTLLERVRAAAFPDQAAGRTPLGFKADVERANVGDIAQYYHTWYAPNNATLVVAGDVRHAAVFSEAKKFFGAIPARAVPRPSTASPKPVVGAVVTSQLPYPFTVLDLAYAIPGDTQPGEPAISTLSTFIQDERSPFYQALVQTNIALGIQAQADTQLKGGLLDVFIVLNPGHTAAEAQTVFEATMRTELAHGFDPSLIEAAKNLTIAQRVYSADSIGGIADLAGYTYGIVREKIAAEDARLAALTPESILAVANEYLSKPTVIGHLENSETQPTGNSQKSSAAATDNFSKRVPSGPIVQPAWIRAAIRKPTTARSTLHPTEFTLANGLRVIVQEKPDRPTFELSGIIASSPVFEPSGKAGIIQLASSVADYGSVAYPFALRHATTDNLGAFVQTGQSFQAQGMARNFSTLVNVIADGEEHPAFDEPWFSLSRGQLANSLQSQSTISGVMINRAYATLLSQRNDPSLVQPTAASVSSITQRDLLTFTKEYWRPDLTTIAVVGDVTPAQVRSVFNAAFGGWQSVGPKPTTTLEAYKSEIGGHDFVGTDSQQIYVRLGQPAIARNSPDYDTFLVLNQILGAGGAFESRLWQALRQQRGLVYGVQSSLHAGRDRGDFRIELNAAPNPVVQAVAIVRDELHRLQTTPVSATELAEAKDRLIGDALIGEASADGETSQILDIAINDLPLDYYSTLNARYADITAGDVERVAKEYLRPNSLIQIYSGALGPWSERNL